jgi:arginase
VRIGVLGVPTSVGSHHAGQENAPDAVRAAGLVRLLREAGHDVTDHGDLTRRPHRAEPLVNGVRAARAVSESLAELGPAVEAIVAAGQVPFVLGGDCTITLGVLAGLAKTTEAAGRPVHLMYLDGDADLSTPGHSDTGILDSMGIAHLLGHGAPELMPFVRTAGLSAQDITLYGTNPAELSAGDRDVIARQAITLLEAGEVVAAPVGAAERALSEVPENQPLALHLDVDILDSGQLPMANFPHFGGLDLASLEQSLRVFARRPIASLTLTEINPSYDPSGEAVEALVRAIAAAFSPQ